MRLARFPRLRPGSSAKHPLLRGNSEFGLGINPPRGSHADASRLAYLDLLLEYLGPARASSIVLKPKTHLIHAVSRIERHYP